jgi:hypothetical protein
MLTVKEAKEEIVFFVNENGFPESTDFYDFVMRFEDENKLRVFYKEDIDFDDEGEILDNSKYCIRFEKVNRPAIVLNESFDTEEEAEDFCFDRVYNYDFQNSCENTSYFESEAYCENDIIEMLAENERIDKEVAASIFRKSKIVFEGRKQQQIRINQAYNEQKAKINSLVPIEAEKITIDEQFVNELIAAKSLTSSIKSDAQSKAFTSLLIRQGIEIKSDFWKVFRIVKSKVNY